MTPHRSCLDALTEAMALPIVAVPDRIQRGVCDRCTQGVMDADRVVGADIIPGNAHLYGRCGCSCHSTPPRQQGRIQDYGRRAG